jgi:hypothetical protein
VPGLSRPRRGRQPRLPEICQLDSSKTSLAAGRMGLSSDQCPNRMLVQPLLASGVRTTVPPLGERAAGERRRVRGPVTAWPAPARLRASPCREGLKASCAVLSSPYCWELSGGPGTLDAVSSRGLADPAGQPALTGLALAAAVGQRQRLAGGHIPATSATLRPEDSVGGSPRKPPDLRRSGGRRGQEVGGLPSDGTSSTALRRPGDRLRRRQRVEPQIPRASTPSHTTVRTPARARG